MARQPYSRLIPRPTPARYDVGSGCINKRPELEPLIAHCLMLWPNVEAEMSVILSLLLGAERPATLAVFQSLRRSTAKREALWEAASVVLNDTDQELLGAVLNVHKAIESERNDIAHGHFGTSTALPEALIWIKTADYVELRFYVASSRNPKIDDAQRRKLRDAMSVYRKDDLQRLVDDILWLAGAWHQLMRYLVQRRRKKKAARLYRQLCALPRIARELVQIRQKNSRQARPLSQPPEEGA